MTEIDSAAFEAGEAPCNFSQDNLSASGSATAAHFSDTLGRVYVTARARLLSARPQAGHTQPALTLVVEDSADGSSWATVATFSFTASDQQSAAVDSPRAYLRASWAGVVGTWAVDVAVKSIATPASGGGSLPDPAGHADGEVLSLASETPAWAAPASGGLPMVIVSDSTGYTFPGAVGNNRDPMPRTAYTVDRDDLNAVTDPADGVYLPAGIYLGGGYIDFVTTLAHPSPSGKIAAFVNAISGGLKPEGDEGLTDLSVDIADLLNMIEAQPRCFQVPAGTFYNMKCRFDSTDDFTVVRWVFWAAQLVDLS